MTVLGIVVIGRNEGDRFKASLESIVDLGHPIVYVDSGSTDGSPEYAKGKGVHAIALDMSIPFTAGRARNAGFDHLVHVNPQIQYVQFVDGDCIVCQDWLTTAIHFLDGNADYAIVAGQVVERNPQASIYNRLMAMEWNTPTGDVTECGGIFMVRASHFQEVGGFKIGVIAGEEPELCVRLRRGDYRIRRIPDRMVVHDAAMTRFSQWWKRSKRCGYAYACGAFLHGKSPQRHWLRETRSAILWGVSIPLAIVLVALLTRGWGLLLFLIYPFQMARIARYRRQRGDSTADAWLYGFFCVLGKFPELIGVLKFHWERLRGQQAKIIEYKGMRDERTEHRAATITSGRSSREP